ncbi:MAG: PPC domain-containing protein, partial [Solirubrobacterales bacterium]
PPTPPTPPAPTPPANDNFANATTLNVLSGTNGTTVGATRETGEPSHGPGSARSAWYRWTAPSGGTLTLNTLGSSYDTLLGVYTGSAVNSLTQRAVNDDNGSGGNWSRVTFPVTAGTAYSIAIDGYNGTSGSTVLGGAFTPTPAPQPPVLSGPNAAGYLTFTGAQAGESYLCRIGPNIDGPLRECESPFPIPLNLTDGEHQYRLAKVDSAGNRSPEATGTFTVTGSPAPTGSQSGLSVNGGATYTADPEVTLDIVWPSGTRSVLIANDGSFDGDEYPVSSEIPWTLATSGAERLPKIVYLKFLGPGGVALGTATDDIVLDQSAPATRAADLLGSSGRIFRVRIAATDRVSGLSRVEFSTRAKKPSQGEQAGQTRAVSGEILNVRAAARPRWYRVSDRAGNWSAWKPVRPAR